MPSVVGIPTTRVSDLFIRQRLLAQIQFDQLELFRTETMLSTGHRFELPSDEPVAALRVMSLQSLLERKAQVQANLATNQTFLSATDGALSAVSGILAEVRATALGVMGTTSTETQRLAAAQQVRQALAQLVDTGNQNFRGRYLFAGSATMVRPFEFQRSGTVKYLGNEHRLASFGDVDFMFDTNLTGSEVFGAISQAVLGSRDLTPALTENALLADLREGRGIALGSIDIRAGSASYLVDLSAAATIGDVAATIEDKTGQTVQARVGTSGLILQAAENLVVKEVGGGRTASDLGILNQTGAGTILVGQPLEPILKKTTRLADLLGTRASAAIAQPGTDNDLIIEADRNGADLNGVEIRFVDDGSVTPHVNETVIYDASSSPRTLVVKIASGASTAEDVIRAFQTCHDPAAMPFTARMNFIDDVSGGKGPVYATPSGQIAGTTADGSGDNLDQTSGLQIVNDRRTFTIDLRDARTVEDLLNTLNRSEAGVLAEINAAGKGINVRSRISGADFAIGENGGKTAGDLGLRSFTEATRLADLNFGFGVHRSVNPASTTPDFTITRKDGVSFGIDLSSALTIGDVLALVNDHPDNNRSGASVRAQLAAFGNGIELVDPNAGPGELTVTRSLESNAAIDLGLIPAGQQTSDPPAAAVVGVATALSANPNSSLVFQAHSPGTWASGVHVLFADTGTESVTYNRATEQLIFTYQGGVTTAARLKQLLEQDPNAGAAFFAYYPASDPPSDGSGVFAPIASDVPMSAVATEILTGRDVHPLEAEGLFTALLRMQRALEINDLKELQRSINLLDAGSLEVSFNRAELGSRQQGLDVLNLRLENEDTEVRYALSLAFDADLAEVVAKLAGQQAAYQAALQAIGQMQRWTLLDYL